MTGRLAALALTAVILAGCSSEPDTVWLVQSVAYWYYKGQDSAVVCVAKGDPGRTQAWRVPNAKASRLNVGDPCPTGDDVVTDPPPGDVD